MSLPTPFYERDGIMLYHGDCIDVMREMPAESVNCCVTSPPYWGLRDYGHGGQIGQEDTPEAHIARLVDVFREVRRVLRPDGTLWVNYGDAYAANRTYQVTDNKHRAVGNNGAMRVPDGLKPKDLIGLPWMLAFALRADGWWLRSDIIWSKPNPMPESVTDRPTKAHEYLFLLSKAPRYYYDADAIKEPSEYPDDNRKSRQSQSDYDDQMGIGARERSVINTKGASCYPTRNIRTVWTIPTQPTPEAHFATFPTALIEPCIKAGCPEGGTVLDPFTGSGTTLMVAERLLRRGVGIELNPEYCAIAKKRVGSQRRLFV